MVKQLRQEGRHILYVLNVCTVSLSTPDNVVPFIPFPPCLHGQWLLWRPEASFFRVLPAALVCLVYIAVFSRLSVRAFERRCETGE